MFIFRIKLHKKPLYESYSLAVINYTKVIIYNVRDFVPKQLHKLAMFINRLQLFDTPKDFTEYT